MPPDFTQSVKAGMLTSYYYTAYCGTKFASVKAAWAHHDPSGVARRVFDERGQGSGKGSGKEGVQGSGKGSGQAGEGSGLGSGQAGEGSGQAGQ
jgi:hypothetical protein